MAYENPIPTVESSKRFGITTTFVFEQMMDISDAAQGITNVILDAINNNGGILPVSWIECIRKNMIREAE